MQTAKSTLIAPGLVSRFWVVSVGKKVLMAASGVVLIGYLTGHLIGNLQIFIGREQLNKYAQALHSMGPLLYVVRAFLLAWFGLHVWNGVRLYFQNKHARPEEYKFKATVVATLSSRTMFWTGLGMFLFIAYHLMHFTLVVTNPDYQNLVWNGHPDVYAMVILGFRNPLISIVYIVALGCVAFHVRHSVSSMFQTMGWNTSTVKPKLDKLALVYAWLVFFGYISLPIAVYLGLVGGDV
jgi:succinate dehydrogenase / fumarate reductase cytochrome b subunit